MPFGYKYEYYNFASCVSDQAKKGHSREEARRICGAIQRDTEEKCRRGSTRRPRGGHERDVVVYRYLGPDSM